MPYEIKPLSCDPKKLKGLSEKLIVSHHENNYGGAVKHLNAIVVGHPHDDTARALSHSRARANLAKQVRCGRRPGRRR